MARFDLPLDPSLLDGITPGQAPVLTEAGLRHVARTRDTDGNTAAGLDRIARMQRFAETVGDESIPLATIRPDLADTEAMRRITKARALIRLLRPTGPVKRATLEDFIPRRHDAGL